jgi:hypothetical protein
MSEDQASKSSQPTDISCDDSWGTKKPDEKLTAQLVRYFVLFGLVLLYFLFVVWPPDFEYAESLKKVSNATVRDVRSDLIFFKYSPKHYFRMSVTYDQRLLMMVMVVGAFGSFIHAATSFADYVGNRRLFRSWIPWYALRPLVGAPTAVLLYFVVRAGFLTATASGGDVNRFGVAAIAGLSGMFSLKAADKLKEVFDTLFKTDEKRKDALQNPVPTIQSLEPGTYSLGKVLPDLKVKGDGFVQKSIVQFNSSNRDTKVESSALLSAKILPADTAKVGSIKVTVINPPPGGGISEPAILVIEQ